MLDVKKGDKVIVKGFTGIKLCVSEVAEATKKTITVLKKDGSEMVFDRKTASRLTSRRVRRSTPTPSWRMMAVMSLLLPRRSSRRRPSNLAPSTTSGKNGGAPAALGGRTTDV